MEGNQLCDYYPGKYELGLAVRYLFYEGRYIHSSRRTCSFQQKLSASQ